MDRIIGESSTLVDTLAHVSRVAPLNRPVLVIGERGSGKEIIAERLHYLSERWQEQFDKVNCAAISESLLDSELFGHEVGAFTGATKKHIGRFERIDGGTLFLDELGTLPMRIQEKLLRVIEYGQFERVGGTETITVDARIVAATNANLPQMTHDGEFRADLLDRLAFDVIHVPPLRQRLEDLQALVDHFGSRMSIELEQLNYVGFSESALRELSKYDWPGNIRELRNVVERSLCHWQNTDEAIDRVIIDPFRSGSGSNSNLDKPTLEHANPETKDTNPEEQNLTFHERVKALELELLRAALQRNKHHQERSAEDLGLSYHQLRALLRKYKSEI